MVPPASAFLCVLTVLTLLPETLSAQQPDDLDRRDNDRVRHEQRMGLEHDTYAQAADIREAFVKNEMKEAQKTLDTYRIDFAAADKNFVSNIPQFRKAVVDYRIAMDGATPTGKSLNQINRSVDGFKDYFRIVGMGLPAVSASEFQTLPREALLHKTLIAAEHIATQLDEAQRMVQSANSSNVVTIQSAVFMRTLNGEIHRLGAMISKLK